MLLYAPRVNLFGMRAVLCGYLRLMSRCVIFFDYLRVFPNRNWCGNKIDKSINVCCIQNVLFSAYEVVSNYEAFITNKKSNKSNPILGTTILVAMVLISLTILLTNLFINCFFKIKRNGQKPKIQNTIQFKTLNLAYGFGLLGSALLHLILMHLSPDTFIGQYTVSIVFNTILGFFIYANDDTLTYLKRKQKTWQEWRKLNSRTEEANYENQQEIGPWMMRGSGRRDIETNHSPRPVSDDVSVIDISDY